MKRPIADENANSIDQKKIKMRKKKKNMMRMGGRGLSLEAFANAKTKTNDYNPALIKKQREFYKNAKYVSKYKKSLKQQSLRNDAYLPKRSLEDDNETGKTAEMNQNNKKRRSSQSLRAVYEKNREEEEKGKIEREAIVQAKKEARERTESQRKAIREKMLKKTRSGQPIMKYRIEHILETIQGSTTL